jgi:hypothetical protein
LPIPYFASTNFLISFRFVHSLVSMSNYIPPQHIQDHDTATSVEPHWDYPDRIVPCANDQGTCEYLDAVYHMHDLSMLYTFILWAVIGGLLSIWIVACVFRPRQGSKENVDGALRDAEELASGVNRSTALIEARLYQPQPGVYRVFVGQMYIIFGVAAMLLLTVLYLRSLQRGIQHTCYRVFKLTHYITAALYLGACWAHWAPLPCWMIAAIVLLAIDRGVRLLRLVLIHTGHLDANSPIGFKKARANMEVLEGEDGGQIVRTEFEHNHGPWRAGQHFYLTFPQLTWWQAHPFKLATLDSPHPRLQRHV